MARLPRIVVPGMPVHVIQRGNNRQNIFFSDKDYQKYLEILASSAQDYGCAIHSYVLMTNHVHLLLTPDSEESLPAVMQSIGRTYVRYFNDHYQRTGSLWEGRYKSALIDSERYFLTCSRYIELNPVRAGMVDLPAEYKWSSFAVNALGKCCSFITPHELYLRLGNSCSSRAKSYHSLCSDIISHSSSLTFIRNQTQRNSIIGHSQFEYKLQKLLEVRVKKYQHGGDRRSSDFNSI